MKINPTLSLFHRKAKLSQFISFDYKKEDDSISRRTLRIGGDIAQKFARDGKKILGEAGRGNWIDSAKKSGKNSFLLRKGPYIYIRGTDCGDQKSKAFRLDRISNVK